MHRSTIGFAAMVVLVGLGQARGTVIFDNFGAGDAYDYTAGWTLGYLDGWTQGDAFPVTTAQDVTLDTIELAVGLASGPNQLHVALMSDASGAPGAVIESFHFIGAMGTFASANPPLLASSVLQPTLSAGTQYWVIGAVPTTDTWAAWNWNSTGDMGPHASASGGGGWLVEDGLRGALRVTGKPIPEPSTLIIWSLLAALGATVGWWRRKRAA